MLSIAKKIFNYIKNLFKKKEVVIPPKPQSTEEIKQQLELNKYKEKVNKLNDMAKERGVLSCYKCGKASGLYKLNLKKKIIKNPRTNKLIKVYICNYCER